MSENLQNDTFRINKIILNAALEKKPIFDAFETLCNTQGDQPMDYVDFEWRYYQYYDGNRDLTIKKSTNNSSPVTFSDLPMDVLEKVVEKTDLIDRFSLRKVARDLRKLVDSAEVFCEEVYYRLDDIPLERYLGDLDLNNERTNSGCFLVVPMRPTFQNQRFHRVIIPVAFKILKNPKLKIGLMKCYFYMYHECKEFLKILNSLDFPLNVRSIRFDALEEFIVPIIKAVKPEVLEEIRLENWTVDTLDKIAETEQWRKAKKLSLEEINEKFPMEKCIHFKEVTISDFQFTLENLALVRDILLKSAHLESCHLEYPFLDMTDYGDIDEFDFDDGEEEEDEAEECIKLILSVNPAFDPATCRFSIPNSQEYFQLKFEKHFVGAIYGMTITRTANN